ncbi:hypothetical protein P7C70_g4830, partial [Phenoliferia sp. Uapishka_3]
MSIPTQFTGYGARTQADGKALNLELISYTPKAWTENDVDIKISHCGICGSDLHVLMDSWPAPTEYSAIVGHEIVGTIVRAGSKSGHVVGTRVGVGAEGGSCLDCSTCERKKEQFCRGMVPTYQGKWEDGSISQGGYADYTRCHGRFAIPIPESISSAEAAPLLCAGVTTYAPLKKFGAGPGKRVGVVGIGGLGPMGAETFALSHSASKIGDAEKLGVKPENFIVTKDGEATVEKWRDSLDLIICTSSHVLPIEEVYFQLLRPEGALCLLGLPEDKLPSFYGQALILKNLSLAGSFIGSTDDIKEMFAMAADKGIKPWIKVRPMSEASQAAKDTENGLARYRFVLEN